MTITENRTASQ